MKGLPGLIKIEQQQLEAKRKVLVDLETLSTQYRDQITEITRTIEAEKRIADGSPDATLAFGRYLAATMARKRTLQSKIDQLEGEIDRARDDVAAAYRELRKYELAQQHHQESQARLARRREQTLLDDLGLNVHRRNRAADRE